MTEELRAPDNTPRNDEIRAPPARGASVRFPGGGDDSYDILYEMPLPHLKNGPLNAYAVRTGERGAVDCCALVCEKSLVPRVRAASAYRTLTSDHILPLVAHGAVFWPPAKQERYVFIYRQPAGKRMRREDEPAALGWKQDAVIEAVVKPLVNVLREFHDVGFAHGAIRPSNMFVANSGARIDRVILGDCLSLPPSYLQSALYEPIERVMAQPGARGEPSLRDDIYSFGVSLAVILRTLDPLSGKTEHEIIQEKMEMGSYAAITGKDRFKGSILELLRGVLHDDSRERWTLDEIQTWLDGRRLSPKQSFKHKKAARPLTYDGRKYLYAAVLAMDLETNLPETVSLVEGGDLQQWFQRSLEDEAIIERTEILVRQARDKGAQSYEERLAAHVSIALDPMAPIRYKGLRLSGDGVGTALVEAMALKKDVAPFVDIFAHNTATNWLNNSTNSSLDMGVLASRFDSCRNSIRHGKIGFGVERCAYILCPEAPCLSEKLVNYYVTTPEQMIQAFEDLCQKGAAPAMFIDRHCAAFLSMKESKVIDGFLYEIGSPEGHRKILGNLKCLASIQKRFEQPQFPGIAKVFMEAMGEVYVRYHDREARATLEKALKKYAADGDLSKMAALLTNQEIINKDAQGFRAAMREYAELSREADILGFRLEDKISFGRATGREISAIVASIIAALTIVLIALMNISIKG